MTGKTLLTVVVLGSLSLFLAAGCSGAKGVSQSNFEKIENGMTLSQVEAILGEGKEGASVAGAIGEMAGQGAAYVWEDGDKKITVMFKDDKVVSKTKVGF